MRFLLLCVIWLSCVATSRSQELHRWSSTDGHVTRARFLKLDEKAGTVVLLVPRTIPLDRLSDESRTLARMLADLRRREIEARAEVGFSGIRPPVAPTTTTTHSEHTAETSSPATGDQNSTETDKADGYRYTHSHLLSFVWAAEDFEWFDRSVTIPNDPLERRFHLDRYGVKQIPTNTRVKISERRKHPVSGTWVYRVEHDDKSLWVLADDLKSQREIPEAGPRTSARNNRTKLTEPQADELRYVDDDIYPDVFGFTRLDGLDEFYKDFGTSRFNPNPSDAEKRRLGVVPIPVKTAVRVVSKHKTPGGRDAYKVIPQSSATQGEELYVSRYDLYNDRGLE